MSGSWKDTFPGAGAAQAMQERLTRIIGQLEGREFDKARLDLRSWKQSLDFNGVPDSVREQTAPLLNDALAFMKGTPPDADLAIGRVSQAIELWT